MFNPMNTATITGLVEESKKLALSHDKLHFKAMISEGNSTMIVNLQSIMDKYSEFLSKIVIDYNMTDEEFMKYQFQPKLLSLDKYKTTELWSSILHINNMYSATQFTKQNIKLYTEDIFDLINEIMILEKNEMLNNRVDIYG